MATRLRVLVLSLQSFLVLLTLPVGYRRRSVPDLLKELAHRRTLCELPPVEVARIVRRISSMRIFRNRLFPRACLRRALTCFAMLSGDRTDASFVVGVQTAPNGISAHSWVSIDGQPLGERRSVDDFRVIYTYPEDHPPERGSRARDAQVQNALKWLKGT